MMFKMLGGFLVVTGSLGLGYWYHERIRQRIQNTETLIRMLDLMMSEIRYGRATLPECCQILKKRMPEPYTGMFERMMLGLRMVRGVDCARFAQDFGAAAEEIWPRTIREMTDSGLMELYNERIRLTQRGMQVMNGVLVSLMEEMDSKPQKDA